MASVNHEVFHSTMRCKQEKILIARSSLSLGNLNFKKQLQWNWIGYLHVVFFLCPSFTVNCLYSDVLYQSLKGEKTEDRSNRSAQDLGPSQQFMMPC